MPVHLYFVRHGQTVFNQFHFFCGRSDPPLTKIGKIEAERCAITIAHLQPDVIFCSPLLRARQTAEIASSYLRNLPDVHYDDRLIERDFGKLDGTFAPFKLRKIWDYNQSYTKSNWGEETLLSLELRVESFVNMIQHAYQDKTVLVFSHGGVGTTIHTLLDENHEHSGNYFKNFHMKNGAIAYFLLEP